MNDRELITDLIVRYAELVNARRDLELRDCFAPGAVFDGLATFSIDTDFDLYLAYLEELRSSAFPNLRQFLGHIRVEIEGDTATAHTQVLLLATPPMEPTRIVKSGQMLDRLVKLEEGWRFVRRTASVDGSFAPPG